MLTVSIREVRQEAQVQHQTELAAVLGRRDELLEAMRGKIAADQWNGTWDVALTPPVSPGTREYRAALRVVDALESPGQVAHLELGTRPRIVLTESPQKAYASNQVTANARSIAEEVQQNMALRPNQHVFTYTGHPIPSFLEQASSYPAEAVTAAVIRAAVQLDSLVGCSVRLNPADNRGNIDGFTVQLT